MTKRACAACDGELDNPIQLKIRSKTVEVCCEDCATKLKEADGFGEPGASLRIARRNFLLGEGTAVAAGLAPTAPAAGRDDMSQQDNAARKARRRAPAPHEVSARGTAMNTTSAPAYIGCRIRA